MSSFFIAKIRKTGGIVLIIKVRTNGERLLVFTNSAKSEMKEFYSFTIKPDGTLEPIEAEVC